MRGRGAGAAGAASLRPPPPPSGAAVYVFGRPLMVIAWGIALWGTVVAGRLAWIAASAGPAEALRFASAPLVWPPAAIAVLAWTALVLAARRARR